MNNRLPFRYVILSVLAIVAACKLWLFPYWDSQMQQLFQQQEALRTAQCKTGVVVDDGCRPLRDKK